MPPTPEELIQKKLKQSIRDFSRNKEYKPNPEYEAQRKEHKAEYHKQYYQAYKTALKRKQSEYYHQNKDTILNDRRTSRQQETPEERSKRLEYHREYYKRNKEKWNQ